MCNEVPEFHSIAFSVFQFQPMLVKQQDVQEPAEAGKLNSNGRGDVGGNTGSVRTVERESLT